MTPLLAFAAALGGSMPFPPPPPIVLGSGSIPETQDGPLMGFPTRQVRAVDWTCRVTRVEGGPIELSGSFAAIEPDPVHDPVPQWEPFTAAVVAPHASHDFAGSYTATYSPNQATIYGFRLVNGGRIHEVTVRLHGLTQPGTIDIKRLEDRNWVELGRGTCSGRYADQESSR